MKTIMYLMNVDWNWIKQRPQFVAEELSKSSRVICITPKWYNRKGLQTRKEVDERIKFLRFYGLPLAGKLLTIKRINSKLRSLFVRIAVALHKPDVIYITYPDQFGMWMTRSKTKLLYDCMDNLPALAGSTEARELVQNQEYKLIKHCDYILATSQNLKDVLVRRYNLEEQQITIVRNGYSGEILSVVDESINKTRKELHIAYIGTISSWMDFELLEKYVNEYADVVFHMIGPVQNGVVFPKHIRIIREGTVEHDKLWDKVRNFDGLIMPFKLNDIIEAVDPVKLYEYINFGKAIITVKYKEIERFLPFVYFYNSYEEFCVAVQNIRNEKHLKYTAEERQRFLAENNWSNRAKIIESIISQD